MPSKLSPYQLDIANLIDLAENDPEAFENEREAALEAFFTTVKDEDEPRLRSMQWRIDQERQHTHNPMEMCIKMNEMMWNAFSGEKGLVEVLNEPSRFYHDKAKHPDNLLQFRKPRPH